ncbi:MAG: hypothetical protein ACK5U8_14390, partial [Deltaproteobacteria bacterium]
MSELGAPGETAPSRPSIDAHRATLEAPAEAEPGQDGAASGERAARSVWIGRVLDERYRIDGVLGEGGMGVVLLAEHLKLQKKV